MNMQYEKQQQKPGAVQFKPQPGRQAKSMRSPQASPYTPASPSPLMQHYSAIGNRAAQRLHNSNNSNNPNNPNGIPEPVRTQMENAFQTDFSDVSITPNSPRASKLEALAYTQGNKIHFAPGMYNPRTESGKSLLGHELAHVKQQRQGRVAPTGKIDGSPVNENPALEREADTMGRNARYSSYASPHSSSLINTNPGQADGTVQNSSACIQGLFVKDGANPNQQRKKKIAPGGLPGSDAVSIYKDLKDFLVNGGALTIINQSKGSFNLNNTGEREFELDEAEKWNKNTIYDVEMLMKDAIKQYGGGGGGSFSGIARASDTPGPRADYGTMGTYYPSFTKPSSVGYKHKAIPQGGTALASDFTIDAQPNYLEVEMVHYAPWNKGLRIPSQISTMGNMNALTYQSGKVSSQTTPGIPAVRQPGQYEWLHMVGSAMGGENTVGNLVAGSIDANTVEIPLENLIAGWKDDTTQTRETTITAQVSLYDDSWVADTPLKLEGEHKDKNGVTIKRSVEVNPQRNDMFTKQEYKKLEAELKNEKSTNRNWNFP